MTPSVTYASAGAPPTYADRPERSTLVRDTARELPGLSPRDRLDARDRVLTYLRSIVEPAVSAGADGGRKPGPDRLAIRHWIREVAAADLAQPGPLQELLFGLDALLRVHLWRDDELQQALNGTSVHR